VIRELIIAGCAALGLSAAGGTAWLVALYARAGREYEHEQETGHAAGS
jgi:hypothetical protein